MPSNPQATEFSKIQGPGTASAMQWEHLTCTVFNPDVRALTLAVQVGSKGDRAISLGPFSDQTLAAGPRVRRHFGVLAVPLLQPTFFWLGG
jgi:hypothetical protein